MTLVSSSAAGIIRPEDIGPLVVEPLQAESTAFQVSRRVTTLSPSFRIPRITADTTSEWLNEAESITPSDATVDELDVIPKALKVLSKLSNELVADSTPEASEVVGESMARDLARAIDKAFFANTTVKGPSGLLSLSNIQTVDAGAAFADLDPFEEAASKLEAVGSKVTAWCASASTCLQLAQLKEFTGTGSTSNVPLLSSDPTQPTRRQILGAGLWPLPDGVITDGTVWALDQSKSFVVLRSDVQLEVDRSFYFGDDATAVRSVVRVGFGWPHEEAVVKITVESGS
ncbi:phage major capsid protein [Mycolicibacterium sp. ELW1]|uniref:phage major capsid protein n=1 Tax=Mycobacteriaceae TaxID=1762 RepID=UPI0011EF8AEE|nr:phage major capsid protein [Mycobacterium sp. ELW1]QEN15931.1 phage major capsid protein [Mycobacterium sp. ELW1]